MPRISIIVPVYNVEQYLNTSIGSLLRQTFKNIEIICINDYSTDNSLSILQDYAKQDSRIKIINQSVNTGQGIARNKGIEEASGEYVMFLDPDDFYEETACETAYNQIIKNNNDFVIFGYNILDEKDGTIKKEDKRLIPFAEYLNRSSINPSVDLNGFYIKSCYCWCQIYNKNFLINNEIKYAITRNAEDIPFFIKAMRCANSISVIDKPLYTYRLRENSTTKKRIGFYQDFFTVREIAYKDIIKFGKGTIVEAYLIYYIRSIMNWYNRQEDINIKKQYYDEMHKLFTELSQTNNIDKIKNFIDYNRYNKIVKNKKDNNSSLLKSFLQFIFSLKNEGDYKCLKVFGIKFKFKRKRNV